MNHKGAYNPFITVQQQFDRIAELLELDQPTRDLLRFPLREYQFSIPVRMDSGEARVFRGFRVQYNDALGPGKGGIRFHPQETLDIMRVLAMLMTWKSAVVDLPLGGSMGGIACDPHDLTFSEQERICRGWVRQIWRNLGPNWDVPAPDLMTTSKHMLWMLDEYEVLTGAKSPGFISGKPIGMGGSQGRQEATGYGVMIIVREALRELGIDPKNTTASFQGFGNVARHAIQLYQRMGGVIMSVSCWNQEDRTTYTFRKKDGIHVDELVSITNLFGEIDQKQAVDLGYEKLPGEVWLEQDVDILVPAAIEYQITSENADKISPRVKIIAEAANNPTTPDADAIIQARDILLIPDLLTNAGGMLVGYFEQTQGNMNYYWNKEEVLGKLDYQMTNAYRSTSQFAHKKKLRLRDAAYVIAVDRVARACHERGWV